MDESTASAAAAAESCDSSQLMDISISEEPEAGLTEHLCSLIN